MYQGLCLLHLSTNSYKFTSTESNALYKLDDLMFSTNL